MLFVHPFTPTQWPQCSPTKPALASGGARTFYLHADSLEQTWIILTQLLPKCRPGPDQLSVYYLAHLSQCLRLHPVALTYERQHLVSASLHCLLGQSPVRDDSGRAPLGTARDHCSQK